MLDLLKRFLVRTEFSSYEDFFRGFGIRVPEEGFNFGYDVVDARAADEPGRMALLWCNDHGEERRLSFADMKAGSDRAAQVFAAHGIRKGDAVMLLSKGHHQFWPCLVALHRLGALAVPASHMLKKKDLLYRFNVTAAKMVICADETSLLNEVDAAAREYPGLVRVILGSRRSGWYAFDEEIGKWPADFPRPQGTDATHPHSMQALGGRPARFLALII